MHHLTVLAAVPLAALAVAVPASAQESPSPSPDVCAPGPHRPIDCDGFSGSPSPAPAESPTYDPDPASPTPQATGSPCPDNPSCDLPGGTPPPYRPPTPAPDVCRIEVDPVTAQTRSNEAVEVRARLVVQNPQPATRTATAQSFSLTRTSPAPVVVVRRSPSGMQTAVTFTVAPPENTSLRLSASGVEGCRYGPVDVDIALRVEATASITAVRNRTRDYSFTGRVSPGRGQAVALFRVEPDGRRVLTARSTVARDGTYRFDRRFTGSGRFGFVVDVAGGAAASAGTSAVRPTVVH